MVASGHGYLGATLRCHPSLRALPPAAAVRGQTGLDLSNNNPIFGRWRTVREHDSFVYLKVSEGAGFTDGTAARMAREARAAGLLVGGYDFLHVCGDSPVAEADLFIRDARADGLLEGAGVLPPAADFELGSGCNASAWLRAWSTTVRRLTHDAVYSDPGYYSPTVGCFDDANAGWVADLGAFQALCGLHTVFWQYSWTAWNGVSHADGDVFRGSYAQLQALATVPKPPDLKALYGRQRALRRVLANDGCRRRARRRERLGRRCKRWFEEGSAVDRQIARAVRRR